MILFWWACTAQLEVLSFSDQHNFQFSSSLSSQPVSAKSKEALLVDWSGLSLDILGNSVDAENDIRKVSLLLFANLTHEQVLAGVSNENLRQSDLSGYAEYIPPIGTTSATLDQFSLQGVSVDPQEHLGPDVGTFMLLASTEQEEALMISFFQTVENEENTELFFANTSTTLSYTANLQQQEVIRPKPAQNYVLDWQSITQSGTGTPIQGGQIDSLMLAGFSSSLDFLEENFVQIPSFANEYYTHELGYETGLDIEVLQEQGFINFSTQERWLLALRCSRCLNPAPLFVAVIEP